MTPENRRQADSAPRIFISAAEPSGDRHAATLIREIRKIRPQAKFFGLAGPLMQAEGCEAIDDFTRRSAMLLNAVRLAGRAWKLVRRVGRLLADEPADLAILVDSPALHLPMARHIKAAGCPVLYYIAPQLWAWAPWRIGKVRRRVDRLAAILPFEEDYFRKRRVDARFVGHPLVEQLGEIEPDRETVEGFRRQGDPVIACLPGSRRHVIEEVLPGQIEVARTIADRYPEAVFLFSAASKDARRLIAEATASAGLRCEIVAGKNAELLTAADLVLCASGTATMEVAWYGVPLVVMYNGSKWGYRIVGRWLIRTPYLCLVNILAGKCIVPEFMPYYTSTAPIAAEALDLLGNEPRRAAMKEDLRQMVDSLGTGSAAGTAARMALEVIQNAKPTSTSATTP